jgi:hypothetical protein
MPRINLQDHSPGSRSFVGTSAFYFYENYTLRPGRFPKTSLNEIETLTFTPVCFFPLLPPKSRLFRVTILIKQTSLILGLRGNKPIPATRDSIDRASHQGWRRQKCSKITISYKLNKGKKRESFFIAHCIILCAVLRNLWMGISVIRCRYNLLTDERNYCPQF